MSKLTVVWDEPDENGLNVRQEITIEEAVSRQRAAARKKNYEYESKELALDDFLTIHYAWLEDE
jgi:hypothetical protein